MSEQCGMSSAGRWKRSSTCSNGQCVELAVTSRASICGTAGTARTTLPSTGPTGSGLWPRPKGTRGCRDQRYSRIGRLGRRRGGLS